MRRPELETTFRLALLLGEQVGSGALDVVTADSLFLSVLRAADKGLTELDLVKPAVRREVDAIAAAVRGFHRSWLNQVEARWAPGTDLVGALDLVRFGPAVFETEAQALAQLLAQGRAQGYLGRVDAFLRNIYRGQDISRLVNVNQADWLTIAKLSGRDAVSILNTWNRDFETFLGALSEKGYTGEVWGAIQEYYQARAKWKDPMIGVTTRQSGRQVALDALRREPAFALAQWGYRLMGPPPYMLCNSTPSCPALMALGVVDENMMRENPMPIHANCVHDWEPVMLRGEVPDEWMGWGTDTRGRIKENYRDLLQRWPSTPPWEDMSVWTGGWS